MAIAESWHVRSRGRECAASQRAFIDGETIVTALFPDPESSGYVRRDYCSEGWKTYQESGDSPFSFWRTKYTAPGGNETVSPVEKLSAEEILQRLVEEDEDHTENARFILAVMLERQKLLRETDSQRTPTGILRVYEHRKTGEVFIVKDPNIPLSEIEAVQNEVFILLENNGKSPERETTENEGESSAVVAGAPPAIEGTANHDDPETEATAIDAQATNTDQNTDVSDSTLQTEDDDSESNAPGAPAKSHPL